MIKNILRKIFPRWMKSLIKGIIKFNGDCYYLFERHLYRAPSFLQAEIMRSYLKKNKSFNHREMRSLFLLNPIIKGDNNCIIDVGGNIGYSAYYYSNYILKTNGICFSFEPMSNNLFYHNYNTKKIKNLFTVPFGISKKTEELILDIPEYALKQGDLRSSNTGLISSNNLSTPTKYREKRLLIKLDDFMRLFDNLNNNIKYIKVDVEGSELNVLSGAMSIIKNHKPIIQIEYNDLFISKEKLFQIISEIESNDFIAYSDKKQNSKFERCEIFFIPSNMLNLYNKDLFNNLFFKIN
jgi:FkbM family methyltransferase